MNILELKGRRIASGYKQKDIANKLGITHKTFCTYENSKNCKFSPEQIGMLSELYNLGLDDINYIFFENRLPIGNKKAI